MIIINASYQENALPAIHIKYITPACQTSFVTGINFPTLFRVC